MWLAVRELRWEWVAYLCVGVVGGLETQVLKAHVGEEVAEEALEAFTKLAQSTRRR
jgi:hypothetical protein